MRFLIGLLACLSGTPAIAQENYGRFEGDLIGRFEEREDRPRFVLSAPFKYVHADGRVWETPAGYAIDGASIPKAVWSFVGGPFSGKYLAASVIHDYYTDTCQDADQAAPPDDCGNTLDTHPASDDVHLAFWSGMMERGVDPDRANLMYYAVSLYKRWKVNAEGKPYDVRVLGLRKRDLILFKLKTVARNLASTDGAIIDAYPDGLIAADREGIARAAERFADAVSSESYLQDRDALGLIADIQTAEIEDLERWPGNKLPVAIADNGSIDGNLSVFSDRGLGVNSEFLTALGLPTPSEGNVRFLAQDGTTLNPYLDRGYLFRPGQGAPEATMEFQTLPGNPDQSIGVIRPGGQLPPAIAEGIQPGQLDGGALIYVPPLR